MIALWGDIINYLWAQVDESHEGFEPSTVLGNALESVGSVTKGWSDYLSGQSKKSLYYNIYQTAKLAGSYSGISVGNLMREFNSIADESRPGTARMTNLAQTKTMTNALLWGNMGLATRSAEAYRAAQLRKGKTVKEANSSLRSSLTNTFKPLYIQAWQNRDYEEMERIRSMLRTVDLGESRYDASDFEKWLKSAREKGATQVDE